MYEACESIEIIIAIVFFGIVGVGDGGEVAYGVVGVGLCEWWDVGV